MICILHGYLLDGSGSNLWTRSIVRALCSRGRTVHLVCQEPHPERYDFVARACVYGPGDAVETLFERDTPFAGQCIVHRPVLGDTLPVYVWDQYDEFEHVVPMTELSDVALEEYLHHNVDALVRIIRAHGITVMHANHAVLMSVVAQRASAWTGVPYVVMPHGSALEYAVRPDERLRRLGADALDRASRIIVISDEVTRRVDELFGDTVHDPAARTVRLDLGVDTAAFEPVARAQRGLNIERVKRLLAELPRGRNTQQAQDLTTSLEGDGDVAAACTAVGDYAAKLPDADVEAKLDSVDWETAQLLIFVGRLIGAKGIHAVLAALPLVLPAAPRTRLVVVGHGPLREPLEALLFGLRRGDMGIAAAALDHAVAIGTAEPEHADVVRGFWRRLDSEG
jgi:glycosyltransferase involved in cell wall biosynthesis